MGDYFALLTPDAFTPSQFRDLHRSSYGSEDQGVFNLLRALLEDALRDALGVRKALRPYGSPRGTEMALRNLRQRKQRLQRRHVEAVAWIFSETDYGVFSFRNICDVLEIDVKQLRAQTRCALDDKRHTEMRTQPRKPLRPV